MDDIERWKAEQLELKRQNALRKAERELEAEEKKLEKQARKEVREAQKGRGRGRPKGGSLSVALFNEMAENGQAHAAIQQLVKVCNDPDHKHWATGMKILMDRLANVSHFQAENAHSSPQITINVGTTQGIEIEGEKIDAD